MKKGISLVALIVTIIVLIILTGAVILSFQDGGIIDRADQAVKDSNEAVLEEKITMMNLEYTQKLKKKFTPETRELLKAIVKQSGIDLNKLLVYYDVTGEQYVFYKIDKVTKSEVEWFLENLVTVGEENPKKIYWLIGDINLDGEVDEVDSQIIEMRLIDSPDLPTEYLPSSEEVWEDEEKWNYCFLIADINGDAGGDGPDTSDRAYIYDIINEGMMKAIFNSQNIDLTVKEEQIKTYFGIE